MAVKKLKVRITTINKFFYGLRAMGALYGRDKLLFLVAF